MNGPPKTKRAARLAPDTARDSEKARHNPTITPDADAPWTVVIDGKRRGQLWGRYASRAGTAATARTLRAQGFAARVVGSDDELEHETP